MFSRRILLPSLLSLVAATLPPASAQEEEIKPTWETQRHARTFALSIPAPRGQIVDRNGEVLANTRLSFNLGIQFPTPLEFSDAEALAFARRQLDLAGKLLPGRTFDVSEEVILKHYRNRGLLPLDISSDLNASEQEKIQQEGGDGLNLRAIYLRHYPHGSLASHIIGYVGREGRTSDRPIQNNDLLWPDSEGREGLEATFNAQLTGKAGQMTYNFDAKGHKVSERVSIPPQPGYNVVTTLDINLQRLCERILARHAKRGAMVFVDPHTGDVLAMASQPGFDLNLFVPAISSEDFKRLNEDEQNPLFPRAYRGAYPPGSIFKMFVALAALESGKITPTSEFSGPTSYRVGDRVFHNWKKTPSGMLNVAEALEESNNTWFYQVGLRTGASTLIDWTSRFGFGNRSGIPLRHEAAGRIPTDEYMRRVHKRPMLGGDVASFSIGQGDILTTPLQMAQAVSALANGGLLYQMRLVKQVQNADERIITGYDLRLRDQIPLTPKNLEAIRKGMVRVISGKRATGGRAGNRYVQVAGKTGTAQWGPKKNQRYAAWFVGYVPAKEPQYAFSVVYEGAPNQEASGGKTAAPIIGAVLKELYPSKPKKTKSKPTPEPEEEEEEEVEEESSWSPPATDLEEETRRATPAQQDDDENEENGEAVEP